MVDVLDYAINKNKIEQKIPQAIDSWLEDHIDPDSGYALDNTLQSAEAAAPAKTVGDAIGELKSALTLKADQSEVDEINAENAKAYQNVFLEKELTNQTFFQKDMDKAISTILENDGDALVCGTNLFSTAYEQGKTFPTGATVTINGTNVTVTATESRKYNRAWFIIPNGRSLIGKYVSFKTTLVSVTSGIEANVSAGLCWIDNGGVSSIIATIKASNSYTYENRLVQDPSAPTAQMAFFIDASGSAFSTVGDYITLSNIQFNVGTTLSTYADFNGDILESGTHKLEVSGLTTILCDDGFDLSYGDVYSVFDTEHPFYHKKVLIIGDSISTGTSSNKTIPGTDYEHYDKWVDYCISSNYFDGATIVNSSIHASGFVAENSSFAGQTFGYRLENMANKSSFDYVIVFGGVNDYIQEIAWTDFTNAVDDFMEYLVDNYTQARLIVVSPLRSRHTALNSAGKYMTDYADYIKQKANDYCLPLIDATSDSGFCPFITSFRNRWTNVPTGYSDPDGVHPNAEYMELFLAPYLARNLALYAESVT